MRKAGILLPVTALPSKYRGNKPKVRELSVYEEAMKGGVVNG